MVFSSIFELELILGYASQADCCKLFPIEEKVQSRRTVVEPLVKGMGTLAENGVFSEKTIGARSSWRTITAANGCNSKRETFWKGGRDAGWFAIEQQLKSKFE
jgi:hypothetical protein